MNDSQSSTGRVGIDDVGRYYVRSAMNMGPESARQIRRNLRYVVQPVVCPFILGSMTRFYFDLYNDEQTTDDEGTEYPDLDAAREAALREVRFLAAESVREFGHLVRSHKIVIRDETGELGTVTFGEVIAIRD